LRVLIYAVNEYFCDAWILEEN
jgi:hypothetical protein